MGEVGHKYFFGQMPEMPWKKITPCQGEEMELKLPTTQTIFRFIYRDGRKGKWHLLKKSSNNGFTQKTNPSNPEWWDSKTHTAFCGCFADTRIESQGITIEMKELKDIEKGQICPACWPYDKKKEA